MNTFDFNSLYQKDYQQSTGLLFIRTYHKWHNLVKTELKQLDITHPQFVILTATAALLRQQEWISQADISRFSDMDVMTVSQTIRLLIKKGLLTRQSHPTDSRANAILLTDEGLEKVNQALPLVEKIDQTFFGKLSDKTALFNQLLITLEAEDD